MNIIKICNRIIEYSFYALFFFVPLVLAGDTSELFEFNKMWLAFDIGILIAGAWVTKSIAQGGIKIQRTPLDIPILLFLVSQILSTIFSMDQHISLWGYYSRFNGGLLSTILYIFLYYAFVSNLFKQRKHENDNSNFNLIKRILNISLVSGIIVSIWGIPSHFGYDPTCFIFRGNLDVACWAEDFKPTIRIFSTLGQPDWLAAYVAILIPITVVLFINSVKAEIKNKLGILKSITSLIKPISIFYFVCLVLFYIDLLYSGSRSGIIAVWLSVVFLIGGYFLLNRKKAVSVYSPILVVVALVVITFAIGSPFGFMQNLTYGGIKNQISPPPASTSAPTERPAPLHTGELGGTDSGKIRLLVWEGAVNAWKNNPLFGTGVETFAFAYYKYKPAGHNQVSEWNFLYNKAHNEFLNYLATTGLLGLGTYVGILAYFLFLSGKKLLREKDDKDKLLILGFLASYLSISVTNFFGFSVVIVNIYLFLIPAFVFAFQNLLDFDRKISIPKSIADKEAKPSVFQWAGIAVTCLVGGYLLYNLLIFWNADKAYGYGNNLDKAGYYQEAYPYLKKAAEARPGEPIFTDELSVNNAVLATQLLSQQTAENATESSATASQLSQQAIASSNKIITSYPNNFVFWKTRVRIFYTLAQVDPNMLPQALEAVKRAYELAPNDASINFNLGVLLGQTGNIDEAIKVLENTITLKPDYRDPRYALGLFYYQKALDKDGKNVVDRSYLEKAKEQMKYILERLVAADEQAKEALKTLEEK